MWDRHDQNVSTRVLMPDESGSEGPFQLY
jgi:hypothetical protein